VIVWMLSQGKQLSFICSWSNIGLRLKFGMESSIRFLIKVQKAINENPVDIEFDFP
jgi:hypothetical protein